MGVEAGRGVERIGLSRAASIIVWRAKFQLDKIFNVNFNVENECEIYNVWILLNLRSNL